MDRLAATESILRKIVGMWQMIDAVEQAAERIVVIDAADERPVGFNPLDVPSLTGGLGR